MPILVLAAVLVVVALIFVVSAPEKEVPLTLEELLVTKMSLAAEKNTYSLVVEESGPGYSLRFTGQVAEGNVYGNIAAYDLEIFSDQNTYFVRGEDLFEEWEEMDAAELGALSAVVHEPLELLETLLAAEDVIVEEGPRRMVDNAECQTYLVEVPPPELHLLTRFDNEDAELNKLRLYLWYNEEEEFLYRMAVLLSVTVDEETVEINRIYNMHPDAPAIPQDVPNPDKDSLAI
ncbi:hypothetical protein [Dethiobacter alkaliphilus]|uniref:hypothetical protein n=1 Tax=Dethiobacter alkaliphilus TaxID=427926 RepID=UPI002226F126|nr:hypothetical protein [Dethiobacter alkaliphilus]MCW3489575.1 hypothetical protein [Dethiobacter alkaliphilus]